MAQRDANRSATALRAFRVLEAVAQHGLPLSVTEISRKYITGRYQSHLNPPPDPHPALDADNLKLGLAMSNLNGVDYSAPLRPAGQLTYTQFKDELIKEFDVPNAGADDDADVWEALRSAAVSCGAFPFAFKVVEVTRHLSEYTLPERATSIGNTRAK